MRCLLLILVLALSSCAPMPGHTLFPEITQAVPIEDVHVTKTIGWEITTKKCGQAVLDYRPGVFWANIFLNFGVFPACAIVHHVDGIPVVCEVYSVVDWDWMIEHELRHCQGYADTLY